MHNPAFEAGSCYPATKWGASMSTNDDIPLQVAIGALMDVLPEAE